MVNLVVQKLEGFIAKTNHVKDQQKALLQAKPPDTEVLIQKQNELDSYLKQISDYRKKVTKMKQELDKDPNFKRMVDSEN